VPAIFHIILITIIVMVAAAVILPFVTAATSTICMMAISIIPTAIMSMST
jgi:hypothetical protein